MTKSKKSIVMHGMLLCPLVLGHCAFLRANGSDYRTSPVVAIHRAVRGSGAFRNAQLQLLPFDGSFPAGGRQPAPDGSGRVRVEKSKQ